MKTAIMLASVGICLAASAVDVSDTCAKQNISASTTFNATTTKQMAYPDGLPTPIFWFDATQTNGWEISGGTVTKIPSLVGDRYLTTDQTTGHFTAWTATGGTYVESDDELAGNPCVDFGEVHFGSSGTGLLFDGRSLADGATASNLLQNIGSVVAVYGSHNGGGFLLGGGGSGIAYLRGNNGLSSTPDTLASYLNVLGKSPGAAAFYNGMIRQDGIPNFVNRTGFSGGWQTLVVKATSAGALDAWGVGLNDCRKSWGPAYVHGGGQKIAELILFTEKLTDAQSKLLEAWLETKWFERPPRGWNGNAAISRIHAFSASGATDTTLVRLGFNVAGNETLSVGRLEGGHAAGEAVGLDKTGDGTLAVDDMTEYDGDLRLKAGTLKFNRRAVPAALPGRYIAHFDASDASSLTTVEENGTNFVTIWRGDENSLYKGEVLRLTPASGCARAFVRPDAFGAGKPVLDLGPFGTASGAFSFTVESAPTTARTLSIATIIAVVGAQDGGGHLANAYFKRSAAAPSFSTSLVATSSQGGYFYLTEGSCFIDGVKHDMAKGYVHPGYQVLAIQVPGFNVATIGRKESNATTYAGGLRIAEIAIYNRALNDEEMRDASAYLMNKWFGRAAPGYASEDGGRAPDLRTLEVHHAGTAVDVPSNAVVRVGELNASVPFEKRGEGILQVPGLRDLGDTIVVKAGKVVAGYDADPSSSSEMAPEPAFHLDASETNRMDIVSDGEHDCVAYWYDKTMRNYAIQTNAAWRPYLRTDVEGLLNGKPVVDFGAESTTGRFLNFCRGIDSIRAVYLVIGEMGNSSSLLGSTKYGPDSDMSALNINSMYAFARANNKNLFLNYVVNEQVWGGSILTNGVTASYSTRPTADFQIIEVHTTAGAHASAFACDRVGQISQTRGGQRLAEVLVYTRPLSARERVATRNYLRAKWFPSAALEDLPADTEGELARPTNLVSRVAELVAADDLTVTVTNALVAKSLSGDADVVKTGAGTLTIGDLSEYSGTISVEAGTLELSGSDPVDATAGVVESGRILHMDATSGVQTTTNSAGVVSVTNWISRSDSTWTAVPGVDGHCPTLRAYGADASLSAVDMGMSEQQCFRFMKNGVLTHVYPIRSVFWVIGSQNGGGFLLGGGTNYSTASTHYNFHRNYTTYNAPNIYDPTRPLINSSAEPNVRSRSAWWMNGVKISPTSKGLSGDWDQISMVLTSEGEYTDAEGFAFDGRSFVSASTMHNTLRPAIGNQRLAEVIIYDRVLTDEERRQNEAYLRTKWSIGLHKSASNGASVALASGAVLDCGGTNQYVAAISGAGTVANGTLTAGALVADAEAIDCLTIDGTFAVPSGMTVELRNLPEISETTYINLLRATSFVGTENLADVVFTGETVPDDVKVKLVVRADGVLAVRLGKIRGTILEIR